MDQPQRHEDTELNQINKVTERIIGCAIEVHRVLRSGLFEATYRSALAIEFDEIGLTDVREASVPALYKGHVLGSHRIDFIGTSVRSCFRGPSTPTPTGSAGRSCDVSTARCLRVSVAISLASA
jgi:hypothetical protein